MYEFSPEGTPARTPPSSHRGVITGQRTGGHPDATTAHAQAAVSPTSPNKVGTHAPQQTRSSRFAQHYEPLPMASPSPATETPATRAAHSRQDAAVTPTREMEQVRSSEKEDGGRHHQPTESREHSPPTTSWQSKLASFKHTFLGKCFSACSITHSLIALGF